MITIEIIVIDKKDLYVMAYVSGYYSEQYLMLQDTFTDLSLIFYFRKSEKVDPIETYHDEEDVPDEESRSSRCSAGSGQCRMLEFRILVDSGRHAFPRLDVTVQPPLLLVDERLHVDARDLTVVLFKFEFSFRSFGGHGQCQVLWEDRNIDV